MNASISAVFLPFLPSKIGDQFLLKPIIEKRCACFSYDAVDRIMLNGKEQRVEGYTVHVEKVRVPPERRTFSGIFLTEETRDTMREHSEHRLLKSA